MSEQEKFKIDWEGPEEQGIHLEDEDEDVVIVMNAVGCRKCKTVAISTGVHDFTSCECGACSADGGTEYIRRSGNPEDMIDLCVTTGPDVRKFIGMVVSQSPVQQELKRKRKEEYLASITKMLNKEEDKS